MNQIDTNEVGNKILITFLANERKTSLENRTRKNKATTRIVGEVTLTNSVPHACYQSVSYLASLHHFYTPCKNHNRNI